VPPVKLKAGDRVFIRKGYGQWSSNTLVTVVESKKNTSIVLHESTHEHFEIPTEYLILKRDRSVSRLGT
jgi:hypothetical protein